MLEEGGPTPYGRLGIHWEGARFTMNVSIDVSVPNNKQTKKQSEQTKGNTLDNAPNVAKQTSNK